ncbi:MAG: DUF364 domain-containing protein [Calditerrivibrio sp.]|nr:DUF364 domain-containing protein [Calditerrivibrio sp.]
MKKAIICELYESVENILKDFTVLDYVLGLGYVAVETEAGIGLSYTFRDSIPGGCNATDKEFEGESAKLIAEKIFENGFLESAIGLATINSVLNGGVIDDKNITDRFDFLGKKVSMVGYFKPIVEQIKPLAKELHIFELKNYQDTLNPGQAKLIIPKSDVVIISGTTFINKTTEDFLNFVKDFKNLFFVGPSTPLSPVIARYGNIMGSYVSDRNYIKRVLKRGAGMKLLKRGLEKRFVPFSDK